MSNDKSNDKEMHVKREAAKEEEKTKFESTFSKSGSAAAAAEAIEKDNSAKAELDAAIAKTPAPSPKTGVKAEINITLFHDGNLQVQGPFDDRLLFCGLWKIAESAIDDTFRQRAAQAQSRIARPQGVSFFDRHTLNKLAKKQ